MAPQHSCSNMLPSLSCQVLLVFRGRAVYCVNLWFAVTRSEESFIQEDIQNFFKVVCCE